MSGYYRFGRFELNAQDRTLICDGVPVELSPRYLDALVLLVSEPGRLVTKDRFMDEVWRGVPVTDEALTQCIRTLRRQLGDSATRPAFIETVVKHGYRFVASVEVIDPKTIDLGPSGLPPAQISSNRRNRVGPHLMRIGIAGTSGALAAGALGGLVYGFSATAQPVGTGTGTASVVLVVMVLTLIVAGLGGAGVSFGIAAAEARFARRSLWVIAGGALGGMAIGAIAKMIGVDAFTLLFGSAPGGITGAPEGAVIGAAVGFGVWLSVRMSLRRAVVVAALIGAGAGVTIAAAGGRMMAGSLVLFSQHFTESRLRFEGMGALFGEDGFGPLTAMAINGLEGALFVAGVVGAVSWVAAKSRFPSD